MHEGEEDETGANEQGKDAVPPLDESSEATQVAGTETTEVVAAESVESEATEVIATDAIDDVEPLGEDAPPRRTSA